MTPKGLTVCVRINASEASALDRAARERGVNRQTVVKQLIASMAETVVPNKCSNELSGACVWVLQ